jgi:tetratricopeptide (TPR) repeat protein
MRLKSDRPGRPDPFWKKSPSLRVKIGSLLLLLFLGGALIHHHYSSSSERRTREAFRQAENAFRLGDLAGAAASCLQLAEEGPQAEEARQYLKRALELCLAHPEPDQVEAGLKLIANLPIQLNVPAPLLTNLMERGAGAVERFSTNNPDAALRILHQLQALVGPAGATALKPFEVEVLKPMVNAHPEDTNRVMELAQAYEEVGRLGECVPLLRPYQDQLGSTEGARILGRALIGERKYDRAINLLDAYVRPRLPGLPAIEGSVTNAIEAAYRRAYHDFNAGHVDPAFLKAYRRADKQLQSAMYDQFIDRYTRDDAALQRALADGRAANRTVQAALDLGMARAYHSRTQADPVARKSELSTAESDFLAVRARAGNWDVFRLSLGQIEYWLGKPGEGQQLFDELLIAQRRAPAALLTVSSTLRDLGEENQARALAEEAYRTSSTDPERFAAAWLRVHLRQDLEEELVWLGKCDPQNPEVIVELNTARGNAALREGDRARAAQFLRQAIASYEKMPRTSPTLNNWSLACLNLYHATGDIEDYNRALALLEEGITLSPAESVQLLNIAHLQATRACMDVAGQSIRFDLLQAEPDAAMLLCLCANDAERLRLLENLRQDEYMKKALANIDQALQLAPKNPMLYSLGLRLRGAFHDLAGLQTLRQRLEAANPDLAELLRSSRDAYDAVKDKDRLDRIQKDIRQYEDLLQAPAVKALPATAEFAEITLNNLRQNAGLKGASVDGAAIQADALALCQKHPTGGTLAAAASACFFRAHDQLKQQNADYARLAEISRRALTPRELITLLLEQENALASLIRQNTNMTKALELVKETGRRFPSTRGVDEWALFRTLDPAETALIRQQIEEDKPGRIVDEMQFKLNPLSAAAVLRQYWTARMTGNPSGATQIYQRAVRDGVPLAPL